MTTRPEIHINAGRHWLILGQTGAGKTYWAQNWFLPRFKRQVVLDTEELEFDNRIWHPVSVKTAIRLAHANKPFRVRIPMDVGEAGMAQYDELADGLLAKGHDMVLYVDEYADFTENSRQGPAGLRLSGKARKRNIILAKATQRPQEIDKKTYTQSLHHVWFGLDPADVGYWHDRAPYLVLLAPQFPIGSFRWVYHHAKDAPQGRLFEPVEEYHWRTNGRKAAPRI